jgi:hypothetical protein
MSYGKGDLVNTMKGRQDRLPCEANRTVTLKQAIPGPTQTVGQETLFMDVSCYEDVTVLSKEK